MDPAEGCAAASGAFGQGAQPHARGVHIGPGAAPPGGRSRPLEGGGRGRHGNGGARSGGEAPGRPVLRRLRPRPEHGGGHRAVHGRCLEGGAGSGTLARVLGEAGAQLPGALRLRPPLRGLRARGRAQRLREVLRRMEPKPLAVQACHQAPDVGVRCFGLFPTVFLLLSCLVLGRVQGTSLPYFPEFELSNNDDDPMRSSRRSWCLVPWTRLR
mmetsp:Transcript_3140/g.8504  ORF Transcript_3140/g.8504 Transcript_3140/m.8504 type:complete len:213 (-) Transcript_3140:88-726(-)